MQLLIWSSRCARRSSMLFPLTFYDHALPCGYNVRIRFAWKQSALLKILKAIQADRHFQSRRRFHGVHYWASFLATWAEELEAKNAEVGPDIKEARDLAFKS